MVKNLLVWYIKIKNPICYIQYGFWKKVPLAIWCIQKHLFNVNIAKKQYIASIPFDSGMVYDTVWNHGIKGELHDIELRE